MSIVNTIGIGAAYCGSSGSEMLFLISTTRDATKSNSTRMDQLTWSSTTEDRIDEVPPRLSRPFDLTSFNHSITAVGFQNRLYLRYLHRNALTGNKMYTAPLYVYVRGN